MDRQKKVKYIKRPNLLKMKAGHGGINPDLIKRADQTISDFEADFEPDAQKTLQKLKTAIDTTRKRIEKTGAPTRDIDAILRPVMMLKAHGGMFKYQLLSDVADICLQFIEALNEYNKEAIEIISAHERSLASIIANQLKGDGGKNGYDLVVELHNACERYFDKYFGERD